MSTKVDSSQLKSKIINGVRGAEENRHIASLQLNNIHICSSGLFAVDYLLTTGKCAWHIENGMQKKFQKGTAVVGNTDLRRGQRINIFKVGYHHRFQIYNLLRLNNIYDVGVIRVSQLKSFSFVIKSLGNY